MKKRAKISISGYDYDGTRNENPWVKNFPVNIELNPDNTLAGFSQPITLNAFQHMRDKFLKRLEKIFNSYKNGSLKNETVEVTFGKEAILMLLSQPNAAGITFTFGINDIPDHNGVVNERVTLMARGAKPCDAPEGYEVIGEEAMYYNKTPKVSSDSKTPKTQQTLSAVKTASASGGPIFEVVPRHTYGDVTGG
ncbi:MAG TPA: hypothetical protein VGP55_01800 [Chitinophagaceae bacterium]|nr:hypothetical protein [Chitinophagaceae bacterium]